MERPATPPQRQGRQGTSPPTPEVARRIEENRLRAKAIRDQHEAARRASTTTTLPKTPSGFIPTADIHVVGSSNGGDSRKRPHANITTSEVPASNRDGSKPQEEIRPARNFTKFVDYNFSAMTDTKGGFLAAEDDPRSKDGKPGDTPQGPGAGPGGKPAHMTLAEWERLQVIRSLQRRKEGPFEPGLSVLADEETRKKCRECGSLEIDWMWEEVLHCCVCSSCKEKFPEKYSLLTKTECREDYLLTEPELKDADLLPHLSRPNPHKSHWHDMMLFLRYQVEEYAFGKKWGSAEKLDAEFARREGDKKRRKETKFKEKLLDLKKKTRAEAFRRNNTKAGIAGDGKAIKFGDAVGRAGKHVHDWGRAVEDAHGVSKKKCLTCNMEVEELVF